MKILGWFAFLVILGATAAMAGAYAWNTGATHGERWAWFFAAAVVALLCAEAALAAGRGPVPPALRWLALIAASLAVLSLEVGFVASVFTDARAARASDAREAKQAAQLAEVVEEPAAVVRLRVDALEGKHRGISAAWCGSGSVSRRSACDEWTAERMRLAAAEIAEKRGTVGDPDARAALLSRVLGGVQERWADALVLLLAVALSLARVATAALLLGPPEAVCNAHDNAKPEAARALQAVTPSAPGPVAAEPAAPAAPAAPAPVKSLAVDTPADLPRPARKVLRVVAERAQPAAEGRGFIGFVPPGVLSKRALAEEVGLSRRAAEEQLGALETAGVLQAVTHGRDGTEWRIMRPTVDGA